MKNLFYLLIFLFITPVILEAQTCGSLSKKANSFRFSYSIVNYEFFEDKEMKLDSAIYYNELILKMDSCKKIVPSHLSDLVILYFFKKDFGRSKLYADKLINFNSTVTINIKSTIFKIDTLEYSKFNSYKILGKIYVAEKNEDSLNYIIKKIDSLKTKVCGCGTCVERQNRFVRELQSDLYLNKKEYDNALTLWFSLNKYGSSDINKKLVEILTKKYGTNIKGRIEIMEIFRGKDFTRIELKVNDNVVNRMVILTSECDKKIEVCLGQIDYLKNIFK